MHPGTVYSSLPGRAPPQKRCLCDSIDTRQGMRLIVFLDLLLLGPPVFFALAHTKNAVWLLSFIGIRIFVDVIAMLGLVGYSYILLIPYFLALVICAVVYFVFFVLFSISFWFESVRVLLLEAQQYVTVTVLNPALHDKTEVFITCVILTVIFLALFLVHAWITTVCLDCIMYLRECEKMNYHGDLSELNADTSLGSFLCAPSPFGGICCSGFV